MRRVLCGLLLLLLPLSSGCWDSREISDLLIVIGAAFDEAETPGNVRLTYEIVSPGEIPGPGQGGGKGEAPPIRVGSSTGPTIFAATRAFVASATRRIFWGHNQILIISQELARKGITPYMDFYIRDPEPRPDVPIVVSLTPAGDILRAYDGIKTLPAIGMNENLHVAADNGFCPLVVLEDFMEAMHSNSKAAVAPLVSLYIEKGFTGKPIERTRMGGTAVFSQGRMVGQLDLKQTRGYLWAVGQVKTGIIPLKYKGQPVSIEIIKAQGNVTPQITNGVLKVVIEVRLDTNLGEIQSSEKITPPMLTSLAKQQNEIIRQEVWAALRAAREMNADILGIANTIYEYKPKTWHTLEKDWPEYYPHIPVEVKVTSHITDIGNTNKGLK